MAYSRSPYPNYYQPNYYWTNLPARPVALPVTPYFPQAQPGYMPRFNPHPAFAPAPPTVFAQSLAPPPAPWGSSFAASQHRFGMMPPWQAYGQPPSLPGFGPAPYSTGGLFDRLGSMFQRHSGPFPATNYSNQSGIDWVGITRDRHHTSHLPGGSFGRFRRGLRGIPF